MTRAQDAAIERASDHENLLRDALDVLRAVIRECRDGIPFSTDSFLPAQMIDAAQAVIDRAALETGHA